MSAMTPDDDQTPVLDVGAVTKHYAGVAAVRDLSFRVERGAICGFLGPNGAGKTTTLRMILDVVRPDAGEILIFGRPPSPASRDRIGFLPEERGLYRKMRAEDVITFLARLKGMAAGPARRRARVLLEENGLGEAARRKVKALSKGMAQKVQILAAIAHEPEFVILDEPFSGLDPVNQKTLEDLVRRLRDGGATVLFSTHVMEHAERLCDTIVLMAEGRKIFDGRVEEALAVVPRQVVIEAEAGLGLDAAIASGDLAFLSEPASEPESERWRVNLLNGARAQGVLQACVDKGISLRLFEPVRPHLHDAFVRLVEDAGHNGGAA